MSTRRDASNRLRGKQMTAAGLKDGWLPEPGAEISGGTAILAAADTLAGEDVETDIEAAEALAYLRDILSRAEVPDADPDGTEALAYLREVLDRGTPEPSRKPHGSYSRVVLGADMPELTFTHADAFDPDKVTPLVGELSSKPVGGLWLTVSSARSEEQNDWERFLDVNEFRGGSKNTQRHPIKLASDARVAKVTCPEDLLELAAEFPNSAERDPERREMLERFPGSGDRPFDYTAFGEVYDALWVTPEALRSCRRSPTSLYGWDLESVVVTNRDAIWAH